MKFYFIGVIRGGYTTITDPDGKPRIICFSKKNFYYNILRNLQDNFPCDQIINAWKPVNPLLFEDTIKSIGSENNIRKLY